MGINNKDLSKLIDKITTNDFIYNKNVNQFHIRDGIWEQRALADRPMDSLNYGSSSPFKRRDTGGIHTLVQEIWYKHPTLGVYQEAPLMNESVDPDKIIAECTDGSGPYTLLERTYDPEGSGRQVWRVKFDRQRIWSNEANNPLGNEGRRRIEIRGSNASSNLVPYGTEVWDITSVYLDPSVDWYNLSFGDYAILHQLHDTSFNGYNTPTFSISIAGGLTDNNDSYPSPPKNSYLLFTLYSGTDFFSPRTYYRYPMENLPIGKWVYVVKNYRQGFEEQYNPFFKAWVSVDNGTFQQIFNHNGVFGFPDVGTDYNVFGMYMPGIYGGTVPELITYTDGFVRIRNSEVENMTPERMLASLLNINYF